MGGQEVETAQHVKTTLKDFCHEGEQGNLGGGVELYDLSKKGDNRVYVQMLNGNVLLEMERLKM